MVGRGRGPELDQRRGGTPRQLTNGNRRVRAETAYLCEWEPEDGHGSRRRPVAPITIRQEILSRRKTCDEEALVHADRRDGRVIRHLAGSGHGSTRRCRNPVSVHLSCRNPRNPVSVHLSCPIRRTDTGFPRPLLATPT